MTARRIVQVHAKDFRTALYIGAEDDTRYLVQTDNLCPDCTSPLIVLHGDIESGSGSLRSFHDVDCIHAARDGSPVLSAPDRARVADVRRRHLDDALEIWSELN